MITTNIHGLTRISAEAVMLPSTNMIDIVFTAHDGSRFTAKSFTADWEAAKRIAAAINAAWDAPESPAMRADDVLPEGYEAARTLPYQRAKP